MITANEAKRITQNNINECMTKELTELEMQIKKAIDEGKFSISNDGVLQQATKRQLEEFGYKVQTGSQYNESYYSISWS